MMVTSSSTRSEPAVLFAWQTYLPASSTLADCSTSTPARAWILSELKTIVVPDTDSRNQRYVGGGIPCEMHDSTIVSPVRIGPGFTRSLNRGGDGLRCSETEDGEIFRKLTYIWKVLDYVRCSLLKYINLMFANVNNKRNNASVGCALFDVLHMAVMQEYNPHRVYF